MYLRQPTPKGVGETCTTAGAASVQEPLHDSSRGRFPTTSEKRSWPTSRLDYFNSPFHNIAVKDIALLQRV